EIVPVLIEAARADGLQPLGEPPHQTGALVAREVEAARATDVLQKILEARIDRRRHERHGRTNSSTAAAMPSSPRTLSTAPVAIAAPGIPKYSALASSCASTVPPDAFSAAAPTAPSVPVPERMTAIQPAA